MEPTVSSQSLLVLLLCTLPIVLGKVGAPTTKPCSMDFSPCTCVEVLDQSIFEIPAVNVTCDGDAFLDGDHLKATLRRPLLPVGIHLILRNITFPLPVNLLGRNTLVSLELDCLDSSRSLGDIHLEAFENIAFEAVSVAIKNCDLTDTSFRFLSAFTSLDSLAIHGSHIISFINLPQMPSLSTIIFNQSSIEEWYLSLRLPNLKKAALVNIGKEQTLRILDNLVLHQNLASLTLQSTNLDAVPPQIKKFPHLVSFRLEGNPITVLTKDSIQWDPMPRILVLSNNAIEQIQSGAFQGNFSSTKLILSKNKLTTVDGGIFKPILDSMAKSEEEIGYVDLEGNPLKCDCDIGWLVSSHRHLLRYLKNANCVNGSSIASLKQTDLPDCKEQTLSGAANRESSMIVAMLATILCFTISN